MPDELIAPFAAFGPSSGFVWFRNGSVIVLDNGLTRIAFRQSNFTQSACLLDLEFGRLLDSGEVARSLDKLELNLDQLVRCHESRFCRAELARHWACAGPNRSANTAATPCELQVDRADRCSSAGV